jgi:beta-lactamase regulating signal transducer with metallopeptidase domain
MTFIMDGLGNLCWRGSLLMVIVSLGLLAVPRRALAIRSAILRSGLFGLLILPAMLLLPRLTLAVLPSSPTAATDSSEVPSPVVKTPQSDSPAADPLVANLTSMDSSREAFPENAATPASDEATSVTESTSSFETPRSHLASDLSPAVPARAGAELEAVIGTAQAIDAISQGKPTPTAGAAATWMIAVGIVYAAGVAMLLIRLGLGIWQVRQLHLGTSRNDETAPNEFLVWEEDLREYCRVLHIGRPVQLRSSCSIQTPLTYGWWRPVLVVPAAMLASEDPLQRRAILLHELTHVQRGDFVVQIAMQLVQALYWFQPLVWLQGRALRALQEDLCDAECSAEFGAETYSLLLCQIARTMRLPALTLPLAMARTSRLARRLCRIQKLHPAVILSLSRSMLCLILMIAIPVTTGLSMVEPVRAERSNDSGETPAESVTDSVDDEADTPQETPPGGQSKPAPASVTDGAAEAPPQDAKSLRPDVPLPRILFQLKSATDPFTISDAKVRLRRLITDPRPFQFDDAILQATSDANGVVALEWPGRLADQKQCLLQIDVAGFAIETAWIEIQQADDSSQIKSVTLQPGVEISARVFNADGQRAENARVQVVADAGSRNGEMWASLTTTNKDGQLRIRIPKEAPFGLIVTSNHSAPYRVVLPAGTGQINDIHLGRGSEVAGQLLDRDGKPIPDCEVVMEADDSQAVSTEFHVGRHGQGSLDLSFHRTTDKEGRFRFPPMSGPVRVYLDCDDRAELQCRLIPVSLELLPGGETWLPLMLSPTGIVSGTVRWPDGKPAANVAIELLVPPHRSLAYITLGSAKTDVEGHYKISVPFPINDIQLSGGGARGPDRQYWEARSVDAKGSSRTKPLTRYVGQSLTVDWVMSPDDRRSQQTAVKPNVDPAWQSLADLEIEIKQAMTAGKDSRESKAERCLQFEAEHRGTRMGIGALHFIMRGAATTTSAGPREARDRAIQVLADHYTRHPDIDLLINEFDAGSGAPACEPLLQRIAEESPFDYVRATALLELARHRFLMQYLKDKIYDQPEQSAESQAKLIAMQTSEETKAWLREQYDRGRKMRALLGKTDSKTLQNSALDLLERVTTHYGGVVAPARFWEGASGNDYPELKLVDRKNPLTWRIRTTAEQAEILRFQKTRLQVGMNVPELEGRDLQQRPIRLSQFRGKVVLLTMTLGNVENELYAECAKIIRTLNDDRFACLSVIPGAGSGGYSIRAIVEEGIVTWPIVRDTTEDDIGHLWCQRTFPTIYLIDEQGIIQHVDGGRHMIGGLLGRISDLLRKQPKPE